MYAIADNNEMLSGMKLTTPCGNAWANIGLINQMSKIHDCQICSICTSWGRPSFQVASARQYAGSLLKALTALQRKVQYVKPKSLSVYVLSSIFQNPRVPRKWQIHVVIYTCI